jgi:hypothetical protein
MKHYYEDVPGLGNVAVTRHAQDKAIQGGFHKRFDDILRNGVDTPDGMDIVWREKGGIRLVILLNPVPFRGAVLVKTAYRVKPGEVAR